MGFYVAHKSRSNYTQTYLSMASTFSMDYVNDLEKSLGPDSDNRSPLTNRIENGETITNLRKLGYKIVNLESGWSGAESLKSDLEFNSGFGINEFQLSIIGTTPIPYLGTGDLRYLIHRKNILETFEKLPEVANFSEPTFTYAHILSPHPPFVFDKDGNNIKQRGEFDITDLGWISNHGRTGEMYQKLYTQQLHFVDKMIIDAIGEIINKSPKPPIIILQSDHGPASVYDPHVPDILGISERTGILMAYYFPTTKETGLYPTITPVNSYRVLFNTFFALNYPLLNDHVYISPFERPYDFKEVTGELKTFEKQTKL